MGAYVDYAHKKKKQAQPTMISEENTGLC